MKLIANSIRYHFAAAPRVMPSSARELFTALTQGITILRIAVLVLMLYVKFKLEVMIGRWRE